MGTISDKTTYLNTTKTLIREKINDLGQNLDTEDTFRSYVEALEQVYEDYPKTTTTNVTEPSIDNTKAGRMEIALKGNTEQFTTTGKNLLPQNKYIATQTINGITYTNNGDGTFSLSGTATANTTLLIIPTGQISLEANQPYYFSSSTAYDGQTFNISIVGDEGGTIRFLQAGATYTYSQTPTQLRLVFYIDNGKTVSSNAKNVKLQVEKGSSATSYEPYTGATASPNPDFPQDVEVVSGENIVKIVNKNLFDEENATIKLNFAKDDNGNEIANTDGNYTTTYTKVFPNTTYTFSYNLSSQVVRIYYYNEEKSWISRTSNIKSSSNNYTFTTPSNCCYLQFQNVINFGTAQLEQGLTTTTYEEHKEQDFSISLHSRNLINTSDTKNAFLNVSTGTITTSGSWVTDWSFTNHIKINGDKLTLSFGEINTFQSKIGYYNANKEYISGVEGSYTSGTTFTVATNTKYIRFNYRNNVGATNIQLEEGTTATTYQPFYDYELCKTGDYKDYIYKNVDKWYVKKKARFLDLAIINMDNNANYPGWRLAQIREDLGYGKNGQLSTFTSFMCNIVGQNGTGVAINTGSASDTLGSIWLSKATWGLTQDQWKSNYPNLIFKLYYGLPTPIDIEITDTTLIEQLEAIYNTAKSYDNVTNITQENNDLPFILDIKTLKKS